MQTVINASDVRKHWSQFNDDIVREGPQFVKRNRDVWAALSTEQMETVLSPYDFTVQLLQESDGSLTGSVTNFDIVESGETEEEVLSLITEELIEYAHEYQDNFKLYFHSLNRRDHFPYIMNVLIQENKNDVKRLFSCQLGGK